MQRQNSHKGGEERCRAGAKVKRCRGLAEVQQRYRVEMQRCRGGAEVVQVQVQVQCSGAEVQRCRGADNMGSCRGADAEVQMQRYRCRGAGCRMQV